MMGVMHFLLLGFVESLSDKETVEKIIKDAGLSGRHFRFEQLYPEDQWQRLFDASIKALHIDRDAAEKKFAEYAANNLAEKFGSFFRSSKTPLDLLRKVPRIHLDLPRAMGATTEKKIELVVDKENMIVYHYRSPNKLCIFLMALVERIFKYYEVTDYSIYENRCLKAGADYCEIVIQG